MMRLITVLMITSLVGACSYIPSLDKVLPDNRTKYQKSEPLPDLEVPPDLTAGATTDAMTIPGEEGASLSAYQRQRSGGGGTGSGAAGADAVSSGGAAGEQWVSVPGSRADLWPRLEEFFRGQGYELEISDMELGVMETAWSEAYSEAGASWRDRFKLFTEPGADPSVTVLFIANERQKQAGEGESADWVEAGSSSEAERLLAGDLSRHFNGSRSDRAAAGDASASRMAERKLAELQDAGDNRLMLALPEEFTRAWRNTGTALERAGFAIQNQNQNEGLYYITYFDNTGKDEGGWLSKLAFWKDDESEGVPYVLSLTGVGDKTELIVLNEKGDWDAGEDAGRILRIIRNEYNRL